MKYLVTGGAGFIGSHLSNTLCDLGHEVFVLDNLSFGDRAKLDTRITFFEGDIRDFEFLRQVSLNMDGIFHLAAFSRSGPSFYLPQDCHEINVKGTLNVLECCRLNNIKRIVYSGSSTFYGNKIGIQKETDSGDFLNFYGLTKYLGEIYVNQYSRNFGLETNILRYFNVYGPGQPNEGAYALVVGIFANCYLNKKPIQIHGSGEQRRDFIHVKDVVNANILAMNSDSIGKVYNIGSGRNYSINELSDFFEIEKYHVDRREGDAEETLADISLAKAELGWSPSIELNEGLYDLIS
jgi:nucleoside-diphosphate-sugar epimerase